MQDLVAVNHYFTALNMPILKQEALMFNRIAVPNLSFIFSLFQSLPEANPLIMADYEWLCDQGILFETQHKKGVDLANEEYSQVTATAKKHAKEMENIAVKHGFEEFFQILDGEDMPGVLTKAIEYCRPRSKQLDALVESTELVGTMLSAYDYYIRGVSIELREIDGLDAYPVQTTSIPASKQSQPSSANDVIEITVNALPIPDENTPWEDIVNFRQDPDSQRKFVALKNWITDVARMRLKPSEVAGKLEGLINDYQQHMDAHRIKTRLDTLKSIVIAEAGFIGSGWIPGLGALPGILGMIVTPLYSIKQHQVALLKEELNAPGKEIAYIVKAKKEFNGNS